MRETSRGADVRRPPGAFAVTSEAAIAREAMSNWPAKVRQVRDQPLIAALVARMGRTERVTLFAVIPAASLLLAFASLANGVPGAARMRSTSGSSSHCLHRATLPIPSARNGLRR